MGVPKFYRWISERYPCLSQVVKDYQIPEFDNFYLDMNGIIHVCSHPNDDDPTFRISDEKIFNDIFSYLEALFRIIKPQKVIFLAVDGVAPRAKMNQQRGRRFRSAREAQDLIRKAVQKGEVLPSAPRFDSNCITPGTEFMTRLHSHLCYFVHKKLSTDPSWQKVEVILSGHDVPGEGEHKIMDYIRFRKAQADYDPNTRHCLYGLDADLMMLGLVSHEPHFSLLREEVRFGRKNQKKSTNPDTVTFHLLHLSIMREYLDFEFGDLKGNLPFEYDLERIIDDWVLMGFLVGNDFLPHLPNMHIRQDGLPYLYKKYMEVLPTLDGYINDGGNLNMERFEVYLKALAQFDHDFYDELSAGLHWLEGKRGGGKGTPRSSSRSSSKGGKRGSRGPKGVDVGNEDAGPFFMGLEDVGEDKDPHALEKLQRDYGIRDLQSYFEEEDEDRDDNFELEFTNYKAEYYKSKLGFIHVDSEVLAEQAKCYVVGIQWVLHYYYSGVPSWSWYYPYHYAPFVSDIQGFSRLHIEFDLGSPFYPYEQLLAVLPPASKSLLPRAYQGLMVNDDSPIKDFYPVEFLTDLNGKQQEWEAVVLIPFIEEDRLMAAMERCTPHLREEEVKCNTRGVCLVCSHDQKSPGVVYPSPWPEAFPDIQKCTVKVKELPHHPYPVQKDDLVQGLCEGVKLDVYFPGFPSLKYIPHSTRWEKTGVRVFQAASRDINCILAIIRHHHNFDLLQVAKQLVGKTCYVGWPYLVEAKVHSVSDGNRCYSLDVVKVGEGKGKLRSSDLTEAEVRKYKEERTITVRQYMERRGIDIGPVDIMVHAQVMQGKRYIVDKKKEDGVVYLHKEWAHNPEAFPYQTIITDITTFAPNYKEQAKTLAELFPVGSQCFITSSSHYGYQAEVQSVDSAQVRIQVQIENRLEPDLSVNRHLSLRYLPSYIVGEKLGLLALVLSRITGNIQVERGGRDNVKEKERLKVGLFWKFSRKNLEVPGYARKLDSGGWSYSPEAVKLLENFMERFPVMFSYLANNPDHEKYYENDLFPNPKGPESLTQVREWMKQLPSHGVESVDCGSLLLDSPQVAAIENAISDAQRKKSSKKLTRLRVKPSALYKPTYHQGNLIPDPSTTYELYDRVVNVSISNAVPFGLRGTIIGILGDPFEGNSTMYEILFDEEFLGGLALRCSPNRAYRLPAMCLLNLSHGKRSQKDKEARKSGGKTHIHSGTSYASAAVGRAQSSESYSYGYDYQGQPQYGHRTKGASVGYDQVDSRGSPYRSSGGSPYRSSSSQDGKGREQKDKARSSGSEGGPVGRGRGWRRGLSPYQGSPKSSGGVPSVVKRPGGSSEGQESSEFSSLLQGISTSSSTSHPSSAIKLPSSSKGQEPAKKKTEKTPQKSTNIVASSSAKKTKSDPDPFSAAMNALTKLNISPSTGEVNSSSVKKPSQNNAEGDAKVKKVDKDAKLPRRKEKTENLEGREKQDGGSKERELSPAVAAIFEAVNKKSDDVRKKEKSPKKSPDKAKTSTTGRSVKNVDSKSSAALKDLLHIGSTSPSSPSSILGHPSHSVPSPNPSAGFPNTFPVHGAMQPTVPEAVWKLMRPSMNRMSSPSTGHRAGPPRAALLPDPYLYTQFPVRGAGILPYHGNPPPMPYGPTPEDKIQQLSDLLRTSGHPPPRITTKPVPNGHVSTVEIGSMKYRGSVCANPNEAERSAAGIAYMQLKPSSIPVPPHPLFSYGQPPFPMYPPPLSMMGGPMGGPGQYLPSGIGMGMGTQYPSHGITRPGTRNPFVPLQAQRRLPQKHEPLRSEVNPLPISDEEKLKLEEAKLEASESQNIPDLLKSQSLERSSPSGSRNKAAVPSSAVKSSVIGGGGTSPFPSTTPQDSHTKHKEAITQKQGTSAFEDIVASGPIKSTDDKDNIVASGPIKSAGDKDNIVASGPIKSAEDIVASGPIKSAEDKDNIIASGPIKSTDDKDNIVASESAEDKDNIVASGPIKSAEDKDNIVASGPIKSADDKDNIVASGDPIKIEEDKDNIVASGPIKSAEDKDNIVASGGPIKSTIESEKVKEVRDVVEPLTGMVDNKDEDGSRETEEEKVEDLADVSDAVSGKEGEDEMVISSATGEDSRVSHIETRPVVVSGDGDSSIELEANEDSASANGSNTSEPVVTQSEDTSKPELMTNEEGGTIEFEASGGKNDAGMKEVETSKDEIVKEVEANGESKKEVEVKGESEEEVKEKISGDEEVRSKAETKNEDKTEANSDVENEREAKSEVEDKTEAETEAMGEVEDKTEAAEAEGKVKSKKDKDDIEAVLLSKMASTFKENLETQEQLQHLTQLIEVLRVAPTEVPSDTAIMEAVGETIQEAGRVNPVGDAITYAALIGGLVEEQKESGGEEEGEIYQETIQPSNSAGVDDREVVVVGEVVPLKLGEEEGLDTHSTADTIVKNREHFSEGEGLDTHSTADAITEKKNQELTSEGTKNDDTTPPPVLTSEKNQLLGETEDADKGTTLPPVSDDLSEETQDIDKGTTSPPVSDDLSGGTESAAASHMPPLYTPHVPVPMETVETPPAPVSEITEESLPLNPLPAPSNSGPTQKRSRFQLAASFNTQ